MLHLVSFTNISDEFWPLTSFSRSDRSARLVCLSSSNFSKPIYKTDIKPSLHIYHAQYLYLTLLFWLSDLWPWHGDIYLDFACYCKITWTKHHINTKTVHLLLLPISRKILQDLLQQYYLNQTSHPCYKREHLVKLANIWYKTVNLVDLWPSFQGQISCSRAF